MNKEPKSESEEPASGLLDDEEENDDKENEEKASKIVERCPENRFIRFNEEIGSGGHKKVYRAYDNDTGCEVAWNVITLQRIPKKDRKKIKQEIDMLKNIKNKNIIHYINAWLNKQKDEVVFITEIVTGGSLKNYLKKIQKPRVKIIKHWCKEILEGLHFLHNFKPHPIIHRDIKCENIFINSNKNEIRIGDLGLATFFTNSHTTSVLGTPEFMAPEIYEENGYGPSCDIYSFGMTVLEMTTLQTPYKECLNPAQIYKKVIEGKRPQAIELILNEDIKKFIIKCLADKDNRPTAAELLQDPFITSADSEADNQPVKLAVITNADEVPSKKAAAGQAGKLKEDEENANPKAQKEEPGKCEADARIAESGSKDPPSKAENCQQVSHSSTVDQKAARPAEKVNTNEKEGAAVGKSANPRIPQSDGNLTNAGNQGSIPSLSSKQDLQGSVTPTNLPQTAARGAFDDRQGEERKPEEPRKQEELSKSKQVGTQGQEQKQAMTTKGEEKPPFKEAKEAGLQPDLGKTNEGESKGMSKIEEWQNKSEESSDTMQTPLKPNPNANQKTEETTKGSQLKDLADVSDERKKGAGMLNSNSKDGDPYAKDFKDFSHSSKYLSDKSQKNKRKISNNQNNDVEKVLEYSDEKSEEGKQMSNNNSHCSDANQKSKDQTSKKKKEFLIKVNQVKIDLGKTIYTCLFESDKTNFEFSIELEKEREISVQMIEENLSKIDRFSEFHERKSLIKAITDQINNMRNAQEDTLSNSSTHSINESEGSVILENRILDQFMKFFEKFYNSYLYKAYSNEFLETEKEEETKQRHQQELEELVKIHQEQLQKFQEEASRNSSPESNAKINLKDDPKFPSNQHYRGSAKAFTITNPPKDSDGSLLPKKLTKPVFAPTDKLSMSLEPSPMFPRWKEKGGLENKSMIELNENNDVSPHRIDEEDRPRKETANFPRELPVGEIEENLNDSKSMKSSSGWRDNPSKNFKKDLNIDLSHERDYFPKKETLSQVSTPNQSYQPGILNLSEMMSAPPNLKGHLSGSISVPNNLSQSIKLQQQLSPLCLNGQTSSLSNLIEKVKFVGPLKLSPHPGTAAGGDANASPNEEEEVKMVQRCLKVLIDNNMNESGHYGNYTHGAVARFQKEFTPGLKADGVVTSEVWEIMKASLSKKLLKNEEEDKKMKIEESKKIHKKKQNQESEKALSKLESELTKGEFLENK